MVAPRNEVRLTRGALKRLNETIRSRRLSSVHSGVLERLMMGYPVTKDALKREWATIAKHALSARNDDNLRNVFTFFGLDAEDPWAWRSLAAHWAHVLFGESKPGRRIEWTSVRQCELIREVGRRRQSNPSLSDRDICGHIAKDPKRPAYFRGVGAGGLRKALQRARSEKHNAYLRLVIDRIISKDKNLTRARARAGAISAIEELSELDAPNGGDKTALEFRRQ
jgi:hypothetical protein